MSANYAAAAALCAESHPQKILPGRQKNNGMDGWMDAWAAAHDDDDGDDDGGDDARAQLTRSRNQKRSRTCFYFFKKRLECFEASEAKQDDTHTEVVVSGDELLSIFSEIISSLSVMIYF